MFLVLRTVDGPSCGQSFKEFEIVSFIVNLPSLCIASFKVIRIVLRPFVGSLTGNKTEV
jgi:hypothetical protein